MRNEIVNSLINITSDNTAGKLFEKNKQLSDYEAISEYFLDILKSRYQNFNLKIEMISKEIGCSREELSKAIKYSYDTTPKSYLNIFRIKKGIELIFKNEKVVGRLVGYKDSHYFYNALYSKINMCKGDLIRYVHENKEKDNAKVHRLINDILDSRNKYEKIKSINELKMIVKKMI